MPGGTSKAGVKAEAVCIIRNQGNVPWPTLIAEAKVAFTRTDGTPLPVKREECAIVALPGAESIIAFRNEDGKPWGDHLALTIQTFPVDESCITREDVLVVKMGESGIMAGVA